MRYDELLVESKYSLHVKLIERIFATELLGELNARLDQLHKEIAKNPDRFASNALWPSDIQNVYAISSPFSGVRNSVPKAIERAIINDQIISAFNVTGAVIMSIDRNLKRNSAGYSREGTVNFITYNRYDVDTLEWIMGSFYLAKIRRFLSGDDVTKWVEDFRSGLNTMMRKLQTSTEYGLFCSLFLHELTHASQASKRNGRIKQSDAKNAFGEKLIDYFRDKISKGILDYDYFSSYGEIDAHANQTASEIIRRFPNVSQLKDITSLISHPIYDRFKAGPIDKNNKKHAIVYQRVWRRFVKHIVLNIQHYIESTRPR